jgi:serine/threonine protein kinase
MSVSASSCSSESSDWGTAVGINATSQLPRIPRNAKFQDTFLMEEGGHARIFGTTMWHSGRSSFRVLKVFPSERREDFEDETKAYRMLNHYGVMKKGLVPQIFGIGKWDRKKMREFLAGVDIFTLNGLLNAHPFHVILMEYLNGAERLSEENCDEDVADNVCKGLEEIHRAHVLHGDIAARNIMVMENNAVIWLDFSCSTLTDLRSSIIRERCKLRQMLYEEMVIFPSQFTNN